MGVVAAAVVLLAAVAVRWLERAPGPTEADLKAQLAAALPAHVRLDALKLRNTGPVDNDTSKIKSLYRATLAATTDTFAQSSTVGDALVLAPVLAQGATREVDVTAISVRSNGRWTSQFTFDGDAATALGAPRESFTAERIVIQGSPEEVQLRAGQEPPPGEPGTSGQPTDFGQPTDVSKSQPDTVPPPPPGTISTPPAGNASTQTQTDQARRERERRRDEQERAAADAAARSAALEAQRRQEQAKAAMAEEDARRLAAENQARQQAESARRAESEAQRQAEDTRRQADEARRAAAEAEARRQAEETSRISDIPRGTEVDVALSTPLNSGTVKVEDRFQATTVSDLVVGGRVLVPAGSVMRGVVSSVEPATRTNRTAKMTVAFDQLTVNGRTYPVRGTVTQAITGKGLKGEMGRIGAGAGVGAIIGGLLGGTKGAIAGILAGAGGTIAATEGKQVELPTGQVLRVKLDVEPQ